MKGASITCTACGCATTIDVRPGVQGATVIHEDACPFLAAVKAGKPDEWIKANGYPLRTTTDAPS